MFKTEIAIDEEKVIREGIYDLDEIYNVLDTTFAQYNLPRIEAEGNTRIYRDNDGEKDFAVMWNLNLSLAEKEWFNCYVDKWIWTINDNPDDPDDIETEDLIKNLILSL